MVSSIRVAVLMLSINNNRYPKTEVDTRKQDVAVTDLTVLRKTVIAFELELEKLLSTFEFKWVVSLEAKNVERR